MGRSYSETGTQCLLAVACLVNSSRCGNLSNFLALFEIQHDASGLL